MSQHADNRVVAFGELLLRLDTPGHQRIIQTGSFTARYTGGEANVAVALARLGATQLVSKLITGKTTVAVEDPTEP